MLDSKPSSVGLPNPKASDPHPRSPSPLPRQQQPRQQQPRQTRVTGPQIGNGLAISDEDHALARKTAQEPPRRELRTYTICTTISCNDLSSRHKAQQLWSSADKAIRSRFVLQQKNKYPLQISLSAAVCWSAAISEISSICT
ncbi:hypothetical protein L1987_15305 [Smallanthus sonchifolius]|uniref:Uncharacterized protein n=1 Tax=Smallanthus sonchifolius TaxID=185202 RepID=A0ACB9J7H5_9ASTR|nr:hypothetical protein L1987_15305 [Smallanthus sonchifolius]